MTAVWRTPEITGLGRLPMHSVPHGDRLSLDGRWRFQLLRDPEETPGATWGDADVPGLPPAQPAPNPTGVYEREFELPAAWAGRRVVLHVGAAESVLIVHLNGAQVGVGKDSHLASEFDVTALLRPGANTLRLTVVKWSDATYIEDQDQWWHGGISRSVFLYATGSVHLADVRANAGLADDLATGRLEVVGVVGVCGQPREPRWRLEA
jgi:beta-galactosidase